MVAPVVEIELTTTFEMTGVPVVVNLLFTDVADVPLAFADTTSKSYRTPAVKLASVTEWLVVSVVFNIVAEPYDVLVP
jgi:hypothetical protein